MLNAREFSFSFHHNWFKAIAIEEQPATFEGFSNDEETKCTAESVSRSKRLAEDLIIAVDMDLDGSMNFAE